MEFFPLPRYNIFRISPDRPQPELICSLRAPAAYMHSFASTKNHIILIVWPYHFKYGGLLIPFHKNYIQSLYFDSTKPVTFYVVHRTSSQLVATYHHSAFFVFHTANAFEETETGDILIDACVYENVNVIHDLYLKNIRDYSKLRVPVNTFQRFRLAKVPTASFQSKRKRVPCLEARKEFIIPCSIELPRIQESLRQKRYTFVYGISNSAESQLPYDAIVKINTVTQSVQVFRKDHCMPGEPIFVSRPDASVEDDGVLLTVMLDYLRHQSFLCIIDAATLKEIATAQAPSVIPMGFHGAFIHTGLNP